MPGALAVLLDPAGGNLRSPLSVPNHLHAPRYGSDESTVNHRTYQTILPLSLRLDIQIKTAYREGEERALARHIVERHGGTSLVCWEHTLLEVVAKHLPVTGDTVLPKSWPEDRFDLIWLFSLANPQPEYRFSLLPQLLLAGDGPA